MSTREHVPRPQRERPKTLTKPERLTAKQTPGSIGPKIRATFHVPLPLLEEARRAVVHLSGPPVRLTLASLVSAALRRELARLSRRYLGGREFPRRRGGLRRGRPIAS